MSWRLQIKGTGIVSADIRDIHMTPTTETANVGVGIHITVVKTNNSKLHYYYYYKPKKLKAGQKPGDLQFEVAKHDAASDKDPFCKGGVFQKVLLEAYKHYRELAAKGEGAYEEDAPAKVDINSKTEFPPLGR